MWSMCAPFKMPTLGSVGHPLPTGHTSHDIVTASFNDVISSDCRNSMKPALTELDQTCIRRLLRAGELAAAAKIYAGTMDCDMTTARRTVRQRFYLDEHSSPARTDVRGKKAR